MTLTPTAIDGDQALNRGLISEVVDRDVVGRARELATSLAAGPSHALGQARRLQRSSWSVDRATSGADESRTIANAVATLEAQALLETFMQR